MRTSDRTVEFVTTMSAMTAIAFFGVFLRLFCKFKYRRIVIVDDYVMAGAWIFTLASLFCLLESVYSYGYTLHMEDREQFPTGAATLVAISQALTSASGAAAKTSIAMTLWKISHIYWHNYVLKVTTAITILATVVTGIVISIKIHDNKMDDECTNNSPIWRFGVFVSVWSVISDFLLSGFPWLIMWNLQKKKSEKYSLCVAMSMGFVTGILGIMKLSYINCVSVLSADLSYTSVDLVTYHFVEPTVLITAACLPVLRLALKEEVRNRRSARASELLDFNNPGAGGGGGGGGRGVPRSGRGRFPIRRLNSVSSFASSGARDDAGAMSCEEMLRGPGSGAGRSGGAVGVAGPRRARAPLTGKRAVSTVTTVTGGRRVPSGEDASSVGGSTVDLPAEGQIVKTLRVRVVSSESREWKGDLETVVKRGEGSGSREE
ncbi:hypothetical protein QBC40DRAFT_249988 [Triangularia verruculosa]|uniref:Rhodopsin domain-containing protein n=1 Tax=Triangularia verruculosa TaxID=2587418 RepID=A0AAN6XPJ8_9PEZI|nr:hypothetical protein QBC40DRAFT_249988 [Triangularia verruculosa]